MSNWILTVDRLPEKRHGRKAEHIPCLIAIDGRVEIGLWNCHHLCWDDNEGDDYRYDPQTPTAWMPLPEPPQ